jgi:hypothetical protein
MEKKVYDLSDVSLNKTIEQLEEEGQDEDYIKAYAEEFSKRQTFGKPLILEKYTEQETIEILRVMFYEIVKVLKDYLVLQEEYYSIVALWIMGTYAHEYFDTFPFLFLNAMRGSGKTRTLKLISALGSGGDGSVQNNLTEAVLFRNPRGVTTCIDEVEQIGSKEKQTLRELFNAAYKKGMKVKRIKKVKTKEGEKQIAEEFEPYFPIAMANINGLDEVLGDRAITLVLEKSDNPLVTKKCEDFDKNPKIRWIKITLSQFSDVVTLLSQKKHTQKWNFWLDFHYNVTNVTNITNTTNTTNVTNLALKRYIENSKDTPFELSKEEIEFFDKIDRAGITGRNLELFLPLLILSKLIGDEVFDRVFEIISSMVNQKREQEFTDSIDVALYQFVLDREEDTGFLPIKELTREFRIYTGEEGSEDRWMNERWMGRALRRLNLVVDKRKLGGGAQVRLDYSKARNKLLIFKPKGHL